MGAARKAGRSHEGKGTAGTGVSDCPLMADPRGAARECVLPGQVLRTPCPSMVQPALRPQIRFRTLACICAMACSIIACCCPGVDGNASQCPRPMGANLLSFAAFWPGRLLRWGNWRSIGTRSGADLARTGTGVEVRNTQGGRHDCQQNGTDGVGGGDDGDNAGFPRLRQNARVLGGDQDDPLRIGQGKGQARRKPIRPAPEHTAGWRWDGRRIRHAMRNCATGLPGRPRRTGRP